MNNSILLPFGINIEIGVARFHVRLHNQRLETFNTYEAAEQYAEQMVRERMDAMRDNDE